ncbi:MAG: hypothetical protein SGBAC_003614 [Bacillariaceae sp.]
MKWLTLVWLISSTWGWVTCDGGNDSVSSVFQKNKASCLNQLAASKSTSITASNGNDEDDVKYGCTSEVVGAFGRMGSFWLCNHPRSSTSYAAAVPRGLSPGCLTCKGCPILVNTPSTSWESIYEHTIPSRRQDLVFIGNGIPPQRFEDCTVVVPHYSILQICSKETDGNPIGTNALSPSTFLFGQHARSTAQVLQQYGVKTEIVETFDSIQTKATLKLFWASCMWLVCHDNDDDDDDSTTTEPYTFGQVLDDHQEKLSRLVDDLLPSLERHLGQSLLRSEVDDYMRSYSLSIPKAIPSKELAIQELQDRNGLWLQLRTEDAPQLYHQELIESVVNKEKLNWLLSRNEESAEAKETLKEDELVDLFDEIGLKLAAKASVSDDALPIQQRIVVVGAGLLGSSTAYFLKLQNPMADVQVVDLQTSKELGKTTPASWAWLNANGKEPKEYQILNQLGLHAWKHCQIISHLPSWSGSLVRFATDPKFVNQGGYPSEGPISMERVMELEPFANWQLVRDQGKTYFFPGEGFVDPAQAVKTFRDEAEKLGVTFCSTQNVTAIVRNEAEAVCGVECTCVNDSTKTSFQAADLVVVAAGVGAAAKALGNLPLKYEPGTIVHAKSTSSSSSPRLSRILVDTMRSSHVLQRSDGSIVAGGGALAVGGAAGMVQASLVQTKQESLSMFETAKQLSPTVVGNSQPMHFAHAVRPMPKDGLPAVGFLQQGLYTVVTHSGMTLGPLLTAMAAAEITTKTSIHLLDPFRPTRFFVDESEYCSTRYSSI